MERGEIGRVGEDTACKFLMKHGFQVVGRNYRKKWGEIDVIAEKKGVLHFVEVKTVSCENLRKVARETGYRPEENVHPQKLARLGRTVQTYLAEHAVEGEWEFDVIAILLDPVKREARVRFLENVVL
jgi:putative endonuclease